MKKVRLICFDLKAEEYVYKKPIKVTNIKQSHFFFDNKKTTSRIEPRHRYMSVSIHIPTQA